MSVSLEMQALPNNHLSIDFVLIVKHPIVPRSTSEERLKTV